jgi:REP element-mobilizing transposase RayT
LKPDESARFRSGVHYRGYLPHVKREGARYFVTFRLTDSLPRNVLLQFQAERAASLRRIGLESEIAAVKGGATNASASAIEEIHREYARKLERYLDRGAGDCWLRRGDLADIVAGSLRFFENERYRLDAWVVMPNHVHAVLWPMPNETLSRILHSWKRYSAFEANKLLKRTGESFWQTESYDHWIRTDEEHARCCRYIMNNPVKARLCRAPEEWRWSSAWGGGATR